jgi:hypothetical protein
VTCRLKSDGGSSVVRPRSLRECKGHPMLMLSSIGHCHGWEPITNSGHKNSPSVWIENDHPDPGGYHPSSRRDYIPRVCNLQSARPLLGISEHPSIPRFLSISLIQSSRGISHPAQEEKELLFQRVGYDPEKGTGRRAGPISPSFESY